MPTPEQIAKRMAYDPVFSIGENVRDMMASHIAQAIRAEREACAKIAEHTLSSRLQPEGEKIAAAIRARTQP